MLMPARKEDLPYATDASRWAAVRARDAQADDVFYYAVRTTGVYCRPSCAARPARRETVSFYDSNGAAERAGYRACKRCKPDEASLRERQAKLIAQACKAIENEPEPPNLDALADAAGLSRVEFNRRGKNKNGRAPKAD
jgi:AraC family transcriptional regulator of adaptative response/methylated-DNA-[protein]-cysteine methyltransferase